MIIEIDLEKVLDLNISVNQYIFIKSLNSNQMGKGIKSFVNYRVSDDEIVDLINREILTKNSTKEKSIVKLAEVQYEQLKLERTQKGNEDNS